MIFNRKVVHAVTCSAGVFFRAAAAAEGKSTKGTKGQINLTPTLYFLNPSSCPRDCVQCNTYSLSAGAPQQVDGHGTGEAVQPCEAENKHQMWRFHQKDGLTMIESEYNPGDCLAVVPPQEADGLGFSMTMTFFAIDQLKAGMLNSPGHVDFSSGDINVMGVAKDMITGATGLARPDGTLNLMMAMNGALGGLVADKMGFGDGWVVDDMCQHGSVGLVSCNHPAAQWISNGANLVSALCWKNGISSFLTVNEGCSELSVMAADGGNDALLRSQTFLLTEQDFIETIVPASTDEGDSNGSDEMPGQVATGDLIYPGHESGSVVAAKCDPSCENGKVCAKHSSTAAGGECYTKCPDISNDSKCTPGVTCVEYIQSTGTITSDCDCETDGKGGYEWMCKAY